jgi:hypothetical protein
LETTFTLTCGDQFYTGATSSVLIEIAPIPTVTLTASQETIAAGGEVVLNWTSTDAERCVATEPWTDEAVELTSGSATVSPIETTLYTIECFGLHETPGGADAFVFVDPNRAVYNTGSWAEDVEVRGEAPNAIALVATYGDGLKILNVNTVENPVEIGSFDPVQCTNETPFGPDTMDFILEDVEIDPVDPDLVYLSAGPCGLWTVRLDEAFGFAQPTVVSILDTEGWTEHVTISGNYAYVSDYRGGVLIVDMSTPDTPIVVSNVGFDSNSFGAALEMDVVGDYAYVAADKGLRVLDVSVPANATMVAAVDTDTARGFIPQAILVNESNVYLSSWTAGLLFFNISDPTTPLTVGIGRIAVTDYAFYKMVIGPGVEPGQDLMYIAEGPLGIRVLDISDVGASGFDLAPTLKQIDVGRFVWDVGITNDQLYIGFGDPDDLTGGFQSIIDRPLP